MKLGIGRQLRSKSFLAWLSGPMSCVSSPSQRDQKLQGQSGAALLVVLVMGIILAVVLFFVTQRSGKNLVDTVKTMKATQEFYLADAGFNYITTKVAALNRAGGINQVKTFMDSQKALGWQKMEFATSEMGYFRLESFTLVEAPISLDLNIQGSKNPTLGGAKFESVQGVLRVPSLARYARYVEGNSTLNYGGGTTVDGEILVAGKINLSSATVKFTRLVSTGEDIQNPSNGQYDFGFRTNQPDIPTLNQVHVNSWDNFRYDISKYSQTFQYFADHGGISMMGKDHSAKNPSWSSANNSSTCQSTGPCDTLFAGCYDTLSLTGRSPVAVAGSAVAVDLSQVSVTGDSIVVLVSPVIYDAGGDGKNWFALGTPARRYARALSSFRENAVLYFPGDIYLTGQLKTVPITVASGDDIFLYGSFIGPLKTEVDAKGLPVTLGIVAQDRIYIHEGSSRELTIRAAVLAENDEVIYSPDLGISGWKYGYVCHREIFDATQAPVEGANPDFTQYFRDNYVWDDARVPQAGFGREPEEECRLDGVCPNLAMEEYGFAVLAYPRTGGTKWKLNFEGSLITRNAGSKGPTNNCAMGWDCNSEPSRVTWTYDDNLGVAFPPRFPAPGVDDRNPTQIIGYKRKSF